VPSQPEAEDEQPGEINTRAIPSQMPKKSENEKKVEEEES
jgi:hypothetical protein